MQEDWQKDELFKLMYMSLILYVY